MRNEEEDEEESKGEIIAPIDARTTLLTRFPLSKRCFADNSIWAASCNQTLGSAKALKS
jgi:hypothetical protein